MSAIPPTNAPGRFARPKVWVDPCSNAFNSTDPTTVSTLANLPPICRALLTFLHIDPSLVGHAERDRLRILVKLVVHDASNVLIGRGFSRLEMLSDHGFPVSAFGDRTRALLDIAEATRLVLDLRNRIGGRLSDDEHERAHMIRVIRLVGYDD